MWTTLFPTMQRYKNESKSQHSLSTSRTVECCFQQCKDTKMKANHNMTSWPEKQSQAVSNNAKIQKWKQITTGVQVLGAWKSCFQQCKDTKMKANHNKNVASFNFLIAVSNNAKIQKWKQITTRASTSSLNAVLFPTMQRYKNESKSQPCKDTKMKANHN